MKYSATLVQAIATLLGWEEVPSTAPEGLFLQPEELATVGSALEKLATAEASIEKLATANVTIDGLNTQVETLNGTVGTMTTAATEAKTKIEGLEAQVKELGKKSSGSGSKLGSGGDDHTDEKPVPSYLDDRNPANLFADARLKPKAKA